MVQIPSDKVLVLFDGYCNLCNGAVQFIIKRDRKDQFRFASLSWEAAQELLAAHPAYQSVDSILVYDGQRILSQSSAALFIARRMDALWPLMGIFWIVPKFIRDGVYNWIARNRYRWFGKKNACMIPTAELKRKFLG